MHLLASSHGAGAVAGFVGDDAQQPGTKGESRTEPPQRSIRLEEPVLCRLLRGRGVSTEEVGGSDGNPLVHPDELLVAACAPPASRRDEPCRSRWPARHSLITPDGTNRFPCSLRRSNESTSS